MNRQNQEHPWHAAVLALVGGGFPLSAGASWPGRGRDRRVEDGMGTAAQGREAGSNVPEALRWATLIRHADFAAHLADSGGTPVAANAPKRPPSADTAYAVTGQDFISFDPAGFDPAMFDWAPSLRLRYFDAFTMPDQADALEAHRRAPEDLGDRAAPLAALRIGLGEWR